MLSSAGKSDSAAPLMRSPAGAGADRLPRSKAANKLTGPASTRKPPTSFFATQKLADAFPDWFAVIRIDQGTGHSDGIAKEEVFVQRLPAGERGD